MELPGGKKAAGEVKEKSIVKAQPAAAPVKASTAAKKTAGAAVKVKSLSK